MSGSAEADAAALQEIQIPRTGEIPNKEGEIR
jgi:hypothetical protein